MAEVIGFFMVFGVLALIIGTLAQGAVRIVGFAILIIVALFAASPLLGNVRTLPGLLFPGGSSQDTAGEEIPPADQVPVGPATTSPYDPTSGQGGTTTAPGTTTTTNPSGTTGTTSGPSGTTTTTNTRRTPIPAGW